MPMACVNNEHILVLYFPPRMYIELTLFVRIKLKLKQEVFLMPIWTFRVRLSAVVLLFLMAEEAKKVVGSEPIFTALISLNTPDKKNKYSATGN